MFESNGYINKPDVHEVSQTDMSNYKGTLADNLRKHMMTADVIAQDTDMKEYINSYVIDEVINSKAKDAILGIVKKLAHMEMNDVSGVITFPIIHTYKGHNLIETTYFYRDESGSCTHGTININHSSIIIP